VVASEAAVSAAAVSVVEAAASAEAALRDKDKKQGHLGYN